jgi:hypothetical protein
MTRLPKHAFALAALLTVACAPLPVATPLPPKPPAPSEPVAPPLRKRSAGLQIVLDLEKTPIPTTYGESSVLLQPMRGRTFVTIGDVLFYVDGDALKSDPALQRGLSDLPRPGLEAVGLGAMGGHWPDAAWLEVSFRGARSFEASFRRWTGSSWDPGRVADGIVTQILPLADGWAVAVTRSAWSGSGSPLPWLSMVHPRHALPMRYLGRADSVATLPDGTLFAASKGRVDRWGPDGKRAPMPVPVPANDEETPTSCSIVALSPKAVFVLETFDEQRAGATGWKPTKDRPEPAPELRRFDGERWFVERPPTPLPSRIFAGPRGTLWVAHAEELYERASDGAWTQLEVPARIDGVWIASDDDVWATSGANRLLHTRPLPGGLDLAQIVPPSAPTLWSPPCTSLTALLDELPRTSPSDVDLRPQVDRIARELGNPARGFAFYDVTVAGRRHIAARMPAPTDENGQQGEVDLTTGHALVDQAKRRGAADARLVCMDLPDGVKGARLVRPAAPLAPPPRKASPAHSPRR